MDDIKGADDARNRRGSRVAVSFAIAMAIACAAVDIIGAKAQVRKGVDFDRVISHEIAAVIGNERAFAAAASDIGIRRAFRTYAARDGITFGKNPENARAANQGDDKNPGTLSWEPSVVGVAVSRDVAFDIGPWTASNGKQYAHGWFMTVWKKQRDQSWQFIADNGISVGKGVAANAGTPIVLHPNDARSVGGKAMAQVRALDSWIAEHANGVSARLAPGSWVLRDDHEAAAGIEGARLADRDGAVSYAPLGGTASRAGDLVFTYGRAVWAKHTGYYLRIWAHTTLGWQLLVDERAAS